MEIMELIEDIDLVEDEDREELVELAMYNTMAKFPGVEADFWADGFRSGDAKVDREMDDMFVQIAQKMVDEYTTSNNIY